MGRTGRNSDKTARHRTGKLSSAESGRYVQTGDCFCSRDSDEMGGCNRGRNGESKQFNGCDRKGNVNKGTGGMFTRRGQDGSIDRECDRAQSRNVVENCNKDHIDTFTRTIENTVNTDRECAKQKHGVEHCNRGCIGSFTKTVENAVDTDKECAKPKHGVEHCNKESVGLFTRKIENVVKKNYNACHAGTDNSYEVWCVCRIVKPCRYCGGADGGDRRVEVDRDKTPTPDRSVSPCRETDADSRSSTPTPGESGNLPEDSADTGADDTSEQDETQPGCRCSGKSVGKSDDNDIKSDADSELEGNLSDHSIGSETSETKSESDKRCNGASVTDIQQELHEVSESTVSNLHELLARIDNLSNQDDEGDGVRDGPGSDRGSSCWSTNSPNSRMDSAASTCSFDHFDFDTSLCSLKSTDTMEPGDLSDQLSMVQQMVQEMKTGFSTAMEELSKIQYGDQTLQDQLADNTKHCNEEIVTVREAVDELKTEVQKLCGQIQEVSEVQRSLQEKVDSYQSDKDILLDELERSGAITDQIRLRLLGGAVRENNNNNVTGLAPMVHPYLDSIQQNHRGVEDQYNSDSSLTAAVSRSLSLTQALGERCLQLDASTTSSDDEEHTGTRHARVSTGALGERCLQLDASTTSSDDEEHTGTRHTRVEHNRKPMKRHGSFQYEEGSRSSQKVPPHEQVLDKVQREEATRDIMEAERDYCSQIWSLLEDYMNPVRDAEILSRRELHSLFPVYIPHIYEQHCIILRKLEERMKKWKHNGVIGDVFAKFTESQDGDGLLLYKDFINDFPAIINNMNKCFSHSHHFRELMQSQCLANAPVLSLLLAPLQQIPKYSLLLKNLLKYTPADHPDHYYLESSLTKLKQFLNTMNDDLETAMQVINMNSQTMSRSRESGHSGRSKSSNSSGEVNHMSRDSGVHSNEEERAKSPMSPNTTRRFVLQMLKDKREHEAFHSHTKQDGGRAPSPSKGHKFQGFGSHPDLSNQYHAGQDGRMSPYLASLPQSKMFSSLSKLPLPRDKGKRSRSAKAHDGYRPPINTNYLRPLTPQVFPVSTSAHNFESARRREELVDRMRHRPASAVEFSTNGTSQHDLIERMANQVTLSPPHSTSSDRSRRDLQLSLQQLLAETTHNEADGYSDHDQDEDDRNEVLESSYHKQFLATKERILLRQNHTGNQQEDGNVYRSLDRRKSAPNQNVENHNLQEDYGIYGDDDDEDDNDDSSAQKEQVKPMRLLPDTHRPKIMVPRWRQNASPQPPSYSRSIEHLHKVPAGLTSEENLAASLAQSLLEGNPPQNQSAGTGSANSANVLRNSIDGDMKIKSNDKEHLQKPPSPIHSRQKSPNRQNSVGETPKPVVHGRAMSFDIPASRPTEISLSHSNSLSMSTSNSSKLPSKSVTSTASANGLSSVTKLTDVIAYTADCLAEGSTAVSSSGENEITNNGAVQNTNSTDGFSERLSEVFADVNMKVSSVDDFPPPSPITPTGGANKVNTENLVNYFQNRKSSDTPSVDGQESKDRIPTFVSMDKTSTPISEHKPFILGRAAGKDTFSTKDAFSTFAKKEAGRMVRGDEMQTEQKFTFNQTKTTNSSVSKADGIDEDKSDNDSATKESVIRAVDKLRMSFERKKQLSEERKHSQGVSKLPRADPTSPTYPKNIQGQFNEISAKAKSPVSNIRPPMVKSLPVLQKQNDENVGITGDSSGLRTPESPDQSEHKQGLYKKATQLRMPVKYPNDIAASARQIQRHERAVSPTGRALSPMGPPPSPPGNSNSHDKNRTSFEMSHAVNPLKRGISPQRGVKEGPFVPPRSRSPTRVSVERERPKSTLGMVTMSVDRTNPDEKDEQGSGAPLKSAMKETKIPVFKKSGGSQLSKSSEDISKIKKKSAFNQLKHIFGRKKKKLKLYSSAYDPDEEYNNHVTIATEPSFQQSMDDLGSYPLTPERRANSATHLHQYTYEDDEGNEISAV